MSTYTTSMFDKIKSAMAKSDSPQGKYRDIMKFEPGNVYTVRIVPNLENPEKTFFRYYTYAWESFSTGQYISNVSPQTWGKKDPVAETRYSLGKHGTPEEQEKASKVIRREQMLANIYVINDPSNPENEGQVKLLRFGKQLNKIIMEAIEGDDSDEFGERIFDLSENGCNLKIKCERQGDFPTYVSSRFASPSKIKGMTSDNMKEVHLKVTDLESVFPVKSYEELQQVLNEHFHCRDNTVDNAWNPEDGNEQDVNENSSGEGAHDKSGNVDPLDDDKVKELLEGLDG